MHTGGRESNHRHGELCKRRFQDEVFSVKKKWTWMEALEKFRCKKKVFRSLDQKLIKKSEAGLGEDIKAKESNRLAPKSPHMLYRYLISQHTGQRPLAISMNRSIELGRQHGSLVELSANG
jgi:hypothetical protein